MKLSNFRRLGTTPTTSGFGRAIRKEFATVTCTSRVGPFWARRDHIEDRIIAKEFGTLFWHFIDDGTYCPGDQAEDLSRGWQSQQDLQTIPRSN